MRRDGMTRTDEKTRVKRLSHFGGAAVTAAAVVAAPATAVAAVSVGATAASVAGMTASAEPAAACSSWNVSYQLVASAPYKWKGGIGGHGELNTWPTNWCGASMRVQAQRKVCGFWGCSWQTKAEENASVGTTHGYLVVSQSCAGGTHRYRIMTTGFFPAYDGVGVYSTTGSEILFTC